MRLKFTNVAGFVVSSAKIYADFGASRNTIPKCKANVAILYDVFISNCAGTLAVGFPIRRKDCELEIIVLSKTLG